MTNRRIVKVIPLLLLLAGCSVGPTVPTASEAHTSTPIGAVTATPSMGTATGDTTQVQGGGTFGSGT